jgi:hypothetical protein
MIVIEGIYSIILMEMKVTSHSNAYEEKANVYMNWGII